MRCFQCAISPRGLQHGAQMESSCGWGRYAQTMLWVSHSREAVSHTEPWKDITAAWPSGLGSGGSMGLHPGASAASCCGILLAAFLRL
jgi:hypothetical protein